MKPIYTLLFVAICGGTGILHSQTIQKDSLKRTSSAWWIGQSIGGNFNFYRGTTQHLNEAVSTATPFHNGDGLRLYFSFLGEYRPNKTLGAMLNVAFNNRSASFDGVTTPGNEKAFLYTVLRYLNIEPAVRVAPFSSAFYVFAGPLLSINTTKEFFYQEGGKHEARGNWSNLRKYDFGAQGGAGIDIPVSNKNSSNHVTISPFVSYQTSFRHPRHNESWSIYTVRTGLAVKYSTGKHSTRRQPAANTDTGTPVAANSQPVKRDTLRIYSSDIHFFAQYTGESEEAVNEIFPLCPSIFFNTGSTNIPQRYIQLTQPEAQRFNEHQLQDGRPANWYNGRSDRQLAIYHQILNILGNRMRNYPQSTITLLAGNAQKAGDRAILTGTIKNYLVTRYGIDASRILNGTSRDPFITSVQTGSTRDPELRRQDDRRVDIVSNFPQLLLPFNSRPATASQPQPTLTFTAGGAQSQLQSWSMDIIDNGVSIHYGPYTQDTATLPATILKGDKKQKTYTVQMTGITKDSQIIYKTTLLSLQPTTPPATRYGVLFDFNSSKTATANKKFLENVIAPQVTDSSTVIIHGHADIIGNENKNRSLSGSRVQDARQILEAVLSARGKKGVKFEYYGFGQDKIMSPFENKLPEERFYNRTVIIDIIQGR